MGGIVPILKGFTFNNSNAKVSDEYPLYIFQAGEDRKGAPGLVQTSHAVRPDLHPASPTHRDLTNS